MLAQSIPPVKRRFPVIATIWAAVAISIAVAPVQTTGAEAKTVFGSGQPALKDGAGRLASFNQPFGMCMDGKGNLYVADSANHCVRRISPEGIASTFAGSGVKGTVDGPAHQARFNTPSGVLCDGKGNLYVCSYEENSIRVVGPDGTVRSLVKSREEDRNQQGHSRVAPRERITMRGGWRVLFVHRRIVQTVKG